jgi:hypothetical protein
VPPVSQAQRRWAWSQKDSNPAAAEFAEADKGGKLPARVKKGRAVRRHGNEREIANKIIKRLNARGKKQ